MTYLILPSWIRTGFLFRRDADVAASVESGGPQVCSPILRTDRAKSLRFEVFRKLFGFD